MYNAKSGTVEVEQEVEVVLNGLGLNGILPQVLVEVGC